MRENGLCFFKEVRMMTDLKARFKQQVYALVERPDGEVREQLVAAVCSVGEVAMQLWSSRVRQLSDNGSPLSDAQRAQEREQMKFLLGAAAGHRFEDIYAESLLELVGFSAMEAKRDAAITI